MADGLFLPDGTFHPFSAAELSTELATRSNAGVLFGELEGWLSTLPDPDPVLRKRGDDAAVLRELSADEQVTTAMLSRKNRVLNCPHFAFRAGSPEGETPTPQAEDLHRRFMTDLERTNLRAIISGMLDAPYYGFTPLELVWRFSGDWWHLVDIVPKPFHWFRFGSRNNPVFVGEYGLFCADPRPLPPGKFVFVTHHASYDNPYGLRLLSRCLWPVSFKRGGLTFYARFVERHGLPWVVGEAPARAERLEKQAMARDLSRMVQDAVAVIPQSATYSVSMDSDSMEEVARRMMGFTGEAAIAIVAILVIFFLAPVGVLALLFWFIYKNRKQKLRLAELAMAKGQPLPDSLAPGRLEPAELVWRKGIRNVSVGLGLACLFAFMEWGWAIGIALFVAIYGGGQMVIARTSAAKKREGTEAGSGEEPLQE